MFEKQTRPLAAIMFTNVAGRTASMQRDEKAAREVRDRYRAVLEVAVVPHGGQLHEHDGDGNLAVFVTAIEAVRCAIEVQNELSVPPSVPLRIGIHTGDGDSVRIASRLQSVCPPGEVLISGNVFDDIKNEPNFSIRSLGEFDLKSVSRPISVFSVTEKDLPPLPRGGERVQPSAVTEPRARSAPDYSSVAVLPFVNMSADADNEYFSDGITEEILNALTRVNGLQVTARTSSFAFKGQNMDIREVGSKLNVGHVLEGSVRRVGNRVRITAQLIDTESGYHVFSDVYDRILDDIFETQDEIALKITEKLRTSLPGTEAITLVHSRTEDLEAYNHYLRGRFHINQWTATGAERALDCFNQAIALDPKFAAAYGGLAYTYTFLISLGHMSPDDGVEPAREAAQRAEKLDPSGSEGPAAMADIKMFIDWDFDAAGVAMREALARSPGSAQLHYDYSFVMRAIGSPDDTIKTLKTASRLDPLSSPYSSQLANAYLSAGRFEDAADQFERTLDGDPEFYPALEGRGWLELHRGDLTSAIETFRALHLANPGGEKALGSLGFAHGVAGHVDEARECLAELNQWLAEGRGVQIGFELALVHAGLEEFDEAFRQLDAGVERRDSSLIFVATSIRGWGGLRKDPRFQDLLRKIGLIK